MPLALLATSALRIDNSRQSVFCGILSCFPANACTLPTIYEIKDNFFLHLTVS